MAKKKTTLPNRAPQVVLLVPPRFHFCELGILWEVFKLERSHVPDAWYQCTMASETREVSSVDGFLLSGLASLDKINDADMVLIPGRWKAAEKLPEKLVDLLKKANDRGARLVSVCTGAFVLAEAGLLDGKRATTHWKYAKEMQEKFPSVTVDPNPLYIREGNIWTSAGTMAGTDLGLEIVREDFGSAVANEIAKHMVAHPHREGGQAQFISRPIPTSGMLQATMEWAGRNLKDPLTIDVLAKKSGMSMRTFSRKFTETTGTTPHHWILDMRINRARELLEKSQLGIDEIATKVGMDTNNFRIQFRSKVRISPTQYRRSFCCR